MHQTACVGHTRVCVCVCVCVWVGGWGGGVSRSIFSIGNMLFSTFRSCPKIVVKPLVNVFFVPGVLDPLACDGSLIKRTSRVHIGCSGREFDEHLRFKRCQCHVIPGLLLQPCQKHLLAQEGAL